jgi:hypothetical protein
MMGHSYIGKVDGDYVFSRSVWKYKFIIRPRQCEISKKTIWLEFAYKGTRTITGPGTPVFEYKWLTKEQYLLAALKGKL